MDTQEAVQTIPRRNFAQILKEAQVDIRREYDRLYSLFYLQKSISINNSMLSLRDYCACFFMNLPFRGTCLSLDDFDDFYEFNFERVPNKFDLNYLLSFCEYSYNLTVYAASFPSNPIFQNQLSQTYIQQVLNVAEEIGYMTTKLEDTDAMFIIVPKSPAAIAVSEITSGRISYKVLEYNHFMLKGNLDRKLELLKAFADDIEPMRQELKQITGSVEKELFQMLHKFVRHNNNDNPYIKTMTPDQIENCYDDIYQMWLLAKLELDNVERKRRVAQLLGDINEKH